MLIFPTENRTLVVVDGPWLFVVERAERTNERTNGDIIYSRVLPTKQPGREKEKEEEEEEESERERERERERGREGEGMSHIVRTVNKGPKGTEKGRTDRGL